MRRLTVVFAMLAMVLVAASPALAQSQDQYGTSGDGDVSQNQQYQQSENTVGDIVIANSNESSVDQGNEGDATAVGGDAQYAGEGQYGGGSGGDAGASVSDDDEANVSQENNASVEISQQSTQQGAQTAGGDGFQFNFFGLTEALAALFG